MVFGAGQASTKNEGNWGMGFLFIFFHHSHHHHNPDEEQQEHHQHPDLLKRRLSFSLSSPAITNAALLSKTQFTLSICALLFFFSLLLFSLFQPTSSSLHLHHHHRRVLRQNPQLALQPRGSKSHFPPPALQGMGALYRRGSKSMTDLVVGHVADGATEREVGTFLRLIHHSGVLSRSDLVLVFENPVLASRLGGVVKSESDSFLRLVWVYRQLNNSSSVPGHGSVRGLTRYLRSVGDEEKEPLWGKKRTVIGSTESENESTELTRASYGSIVGFDASELDPEDSLSGFLGRVPMSLRRWACYPMLLGRVRRNYKHTLLISVGNSLIFSDPFTQIRNRTTESVLLWSNSARPSQLNPAVLLGGGRGIRRFAIAALTEIVRVVVEHKGKTRRNSVTESGLVDQLAHNAHLLKHVNLIISDESIPDASSLGHSVDSSGPGLLGFSDYFAVIQRGSYDVDSVVRREICSSHELYSTVFRDCLPSH